MNTLKPNEFKNSTNQISSGRKLSLLYKWKNLIGASLVLIEIKVSNPSMLLQGVLSSLQPDREKGFRFVKKDTVISKHKCCKAI